MSGGHFDYNQARIREVVESLQETIQKEISPRPHLKHELCISVWRELGGGSFQSTHYHFDTYEEAYEYFKGQGYKISESENPSKNPPFDNKRSFHALGKDEVLEVREFSYEYYEDENGEQVYYNDFSKETLEELKKGLDLLNRAYIYAQRIDWLLCGDDGEESFHKRLKEDLDKYEKTGEI